MKGSARPGSEGAGAGGTVPRPPNGEEQGEIAGGRVWRRVRTGRRRERPGGDFRPGKCYATDRMAVACPGRGYTAPESHKRRSLLGE
jgi:hypothetical protein